MFSSKQLNNMVYFLKTSKADGEEEAVEYLNLMNAVKVQIALKIREAQIEAKKKPSKKKSVKKKSVKKKSVKKKSVRKVKKKKGKKRR